MLHFTVIAISSRENVVSTLDPGGSALLHSSICNVNLLLSQYRDVVMLNRLLISKYVNYRPPRPFSVRPVSNGVRSYVDTVIRFFRKLSLLDSWFINRYEKATQDRGTA